jgi:carboxypeptidase D
MVLPKVLARIPVLLFAGDQDLICNYVGLEAMMQAMEWNGAKGLGVRYRGVSYFYSQLILAQTVQTQSWSVAGSPAGTWVASRNLTYAKVQTWFPQLRRLTRTTDLQRLAYGSL